MDSPLSLRQADRGENKDPVSIDPSRIALKLSSKAHKQLQSQPEFISDLIRKAEPNFGPIPRAKPLITSQSSAVIAEKVALATQLDPTYKPTDFDTWYQVPLEPQSAVVAKDSAAPALTVPNEVVQLVQKLHNLEDVESVHVLRAGPPPVNPSDDPRSTNEGFLDAAPEGIDARYSWGFPGGDGAGSNFIDMEQGWNLNHEDLAAAHVTLISGTNSAYFDHGTSVLGEILMVDNTTGGVGIAPSGKGRVISQHQPGGYNTAATILDAVAHMNFGDILLLEAQEFDPVSSQYYWPVEVADANYDAIRLATALGITVIEAGCNGSYDLDTYVNLSGKNIFNRSSADFRDSGAIMVGAGSSAVPHTRLYFSNHGSRVDVYAWGENVDSTSTDAAGTNTTLYTGSFGGTSSASPIITGAAMIIQGLANASLGYQLAPLQVRKILTTDGTASSNPAVDRIGVQPNLKAIIDSSYFNLAPDLYIRDYVGDVGNKTTGIFCQSPDIIVRQQALADPQASLGAGSGAEDNSALSQPVLAGRDHSIYIRLLNRGGSPADSAKATVYWSEGSTLVTPNLWHEIGSLSIPSIPTGRILTVSPHLIWPAAAVPPTGHYCFVAIVGATDDPAPGLPATFPDWVTFVQNNNNVAWRNFNVITAPPSAGLRAFHIFPFHIPGAFDAPRRFTIKALGSLPPAAEVLLQAPLTLTKALGIPLRQGQINGDKALLPLHQFGLSDVGKGILPVASSAACQLHVRVPADTYKLKGTFEFAMIQVWEDIEVGRVTYHFGPEGSLGKGGN